MTRLLTSICCLLIVALAPVPSAKAATENNTNLFEVAVPVVSQASSERAKAARLGLRIVILRVAGSPDAIDSDAMLRAYDQAQNYIEQFHYEPYTPGKKPREYRNATEQLVMTFSQSVIEQLMRDAGLPYWPPNRPRVLVWLVENTSGDGKALVNDRNMELVAGLREGAWERGLQIQLPLLDLEDQVALPAKKLWLLDESAIFAASERYDADTILVGRYSQTSRGTWLSTWQYFHRGAGREYDYRSDTGLELGAEVIDPLADYLASLYAISPQEHAGPELVVQLSRIKTFGNYRQALDYLGGLAMVSDVQVRAVRGDTLLLYLKSDGGHDSLRNSLILDRKLQPAPPSELDADVPPWLQRQEGTPEHPLKYVWQTY